MNWIKDIIPNIKRNLSQTFGEDRQSKVPEGLWRSCENCGAILYIQSLKRAPMYVLNVGTISKLMYQKE